MKSWWQRRTVRFRLALWYAVVGTLLLAALSGTFYLYVSNRMAQPLDHQLRLDLAEVRLRLTVRPDGTVLWNGTEIPRDGRWDANNPWFELWDQNGRLLRRQWPFTDERVEQLPAAPARDRETLSVFDVARDLRLRTLSVPYPAAGGGPPWMLRIMTVHEPVSDALGALRLIIVVALPAVVALLVAGGYFITRRWLRPLDQAVAEAGRISAAELNRRLTVVSPHDEIGRLATAFNVTLDRLESSFQTLDRFVADASHELRTPLTTLRSVGEVGLRRSRTVEEYREIIGSMLEESQRLQLLIQRLLELASTEGGAPVIERRRIELDRFVASCIAELGILAENRGQELVLDATPCQVLTDPIFLRQALQNIVDNAIKYSPDRSTIRVAVRQSGPICSVAVTDQGMGISPKDRHRLALRFYRPDGGRGRSTGGFGLGLALTKAYMRVLGGSLDYEPALPHGSIFRLSLPAAEVQPSPD